MNGVLGIFFAVITSLFYNYVFISFLFNFLLYVGLCLMCEVNWFQDNCVNTFCKKYMILLLFWYVYVNHIYICYLVCRYDSEGNDASLSTLSSNSIPSSNNGSKSVYSDCVQVSYITSNLRGLRRYSFQNKSGLIMYPIILDSNFSFPSIAKMVNSWYPTQ